MRDIRRFSEARDSKDRERDRRRATGAAGAADPDAGADEDADADADVDADGNESHLGAACDQTLASHTRPTVTIATSLAISMQLRARTCPDSVNC